MTKLLDFSDAKAGDLLLYYHWGVDSDEHSWLDGVTVIANIDWHNHLVDTLDWHGNIGAFNFSEYTTYNWKLVKAIT